MTGGRLKRVLNYVEDQDFCFTYGDGLSDIDVTATIAFHRKQGTKATVTAVQPAGRFGAIDVKGERVSGFEEKPRGDRAWTNGGFFVLSSGVAQYLDGDDSLVWEQQPMRTLAADGELSAFRHEGFWQPMDTLARPPRARGVVGFRPGAMADVDMSAVDPDFWRDRRVLLTGHTASRAPGCRCGSSRSARELRASRSMCPRNRRCTSWPRVGEGLESIEGDIRDPGGGRGGGRGGRSGGRHPHGGAVARASLVRRAARDI